ncbi:MAG: YqcC family protein [Pseudomonadota bacterium]
MHHAAASLLIDLESDLRRLGVWEVHPPSAEALASQEPFAIDTLKFTQWLQFIFVPKMYALIESRAPLPVSCAITPMAEEYFRGAALPIADLMETLRSVDDLLSENSQEPN